MSIVFYTNKAHRLHSTQKKNWLERMMTFDPFTVLSLSKLQRQLTHYIRGVDVRKKTATKMHGLVKTTKQNKSCVDKYAIFILTKVHYIWERSSVITMSNTRIQSCPLLLQFLERCSKGNVVKSTTVGGNINQILTFNCI